MKLSIIIVNYNTHVFLEDALRSLYKDNDAKSYQVIVVDNASERGSLDSLKKKYPLVKHIHSPVNLGFGKANNLGAKSAKGEYLLFLNPDTIVPPQTISKIIPTLDELPNLGAYSCQLRYSDGSIQPSGGYFPTLARVIYWQIFSDGYPLRPTIIKPIHPTAEYFKKDFSPDWIMGACLFIPKQAFEKIKGFDKRIFMYAEDIEICHRLTSAGYKIYFRSTPYITHLQSKASSSAYALTSEVDGIKYLASKYLPKWHYPLIAFSFKLGSLLRLLIFGIMMNNASKRDTYAQTLLHH